MCLYQAWLLCPPLCSRLSKRRKVNHFKMWPLPKLTCLRQMNMDYCLIQALRRHQGTAYFYLIYDIICQYWPNLLRRIQGYTMLKWPEDITVSRGIGKFHVGGHIKACFPRFNPWFIPNIGVIDGEVIETRWANLNEISGSTRTMTTSHRREMLNDHMNDCNWQKTVSGGNCFVFMADHPPLTTSQFHCLSKNGKRPKSWSNQQRPTSKRLPRALAKILFKSGLWWLQRRRRTGTTIQRPWMCMMCRMSSVSCITYRAMLLMVTLHYLVSFLQSG